MTRRKDGSPPGFVPVHVTQPKQAYQYREDLKELYSVFSAGNAFRAETLYDRIFKGLRLVGLADENGTLVAIATIVLCQSALKVYCLIEEVSVLPGLQGKGLGRKLMEELLSYISERMPRCEYLELTSNPTRIAANALYQSLGFELIASGQTNLYRKNISRK